MTFTRVLLLCVPLAALASCAGTRHAAQIGVAGFDDEYEPFDRQLSIGWSMNMHRETSGLGYEVGAQFMGDQGEVQSIDASIGALELYGGPRYEWVLQKVNPYIAGGLSLLASELEGELGGLSASDDDSTFGAYVGGGVDFDITETVFMGLGGRFTVGHEPQFFGSELDGDFLQFFLRVGATF